MRTVHVIYKSYKVKLAYLRFPLSLFILNRVMINIFLFLIRLLSLRTFKTSRWKRYIFLMCMHEIRKKDKLIDWLTVSKLLQQMKILFETVRFLYVFCNIFFQLWKFIIILNSVFLIYINLVKCCPRGTPIKTEE